jgi:flagellar basal body rod protein FlgG
MSMQITEVAAQILARAERRAEIAAQNITNASTPGYRRRVGFDETLRPGGDGGGGPARAGAVATDFRAGQLTETGAKTDLAIAGDGFFAVRGEDRVFYTRHGQFRRDGEGRLVTGEGLALQSSEGGDLIVGDGDFAVAADGVVTRDGAPVARVALFDFAERGALASGAGGAFLAGEAEPVPVSAPAIRQGMLESSNVNMGDEMVAMMEAVRRAETGQRLVTTYDDLMGRALNLFGQQ